MPRALPRALLAVLSASILVACSGGADRDLAQSPSTTAAVTATATTPAGLPGTPPSTATSPVPTGSPAPSTPATSPTTGPAAAVGEQTLGNLSFRLPGRWKSVDAKAPDLEKQLEELKVPAASRRDLLAQQGGLQTFDQVKLFFEPRDPQDGNVIVGRVKARSDPALRDLEQAAHATGRALGDSTPAVRRVRVADREAVLLTVKIRGREAQAVQQQIYLPGEREFYLLGFTYSPKRSAASQKRAFEEFRDSIRVDPDQA